MANRKGSKKIKERFITAKPSYLRGLFLSPGTSGMVSIEKSLIFFDFFTQVTK